MPNTSSSLTPAYAIAAVTSIVALFATQGLIDNNVEKLVTGIASIVIPAVFALAHAVFHGRVQAAKIAAAQPTPASPAPVANTTPTVPPAAPTVPPAA
jgi:hypothetical protein